MARDDEPVELDFVRLEYETDDAWLILFEPGKSVWIAKSLGKIDARDKKVTVPEWLAIKKELV